MVDYSKWNSIELSDDDEDDCHPNIDLQLWKRLKKEKREKEAAEAVQKRRREDKEHADGTARLKEIDARLAATPAPDDIEAAAMRTERAAVQAAVDRITKLRLDEEAKNKKYPKWNASNIITAEKFDKTMLNTEDRSRPAPGLAAAVGSAATPAAKPAATPAATPAAGPVAGPATAATPPSAPAPAPAAAAATKTAAPAEPAPVIRPGAAAVLKPETKAGEVSEEDVDAWVKQMELKAHKFAASKTYDDYYKVLQQYPEIMVAETQDYLLLHVSDFIKRGMYAESKHYLRAACIVQYSMELGKNGVQLFFHRMRDEKGGYSKVFERETAEYWERIRTKLEEMRKEKAAKAVSSSGNDDDNDDD